MSEIKVCKFRGSHLLSVDIRHGMSRFRGVYVIYGWASSRRVASLTGSTIGLAVHWCRVISVTSWSSVRCLSVLVIWPVFVSRLECWPVVVSHVSPRSVCVSGIWVSVLVKVVPWFVVLVEAWLVVGVVVGVVSSWLVEHLVL